MEQPMKPDLVVRGGTVVTEHLTFAADIVVHDGRIVSVGEFRGETASVFDAAGADADLVVVDMDRRETPGAARLASRGEVSAYEGHERQRLAGRDLRPRQDGRRGRPRPRGARLGQARRATLPPPAPRNLDKHLATLCGRSPAPVR